MLSSIIFHGGQAFQISTYFLSCYKSIIDRVRQFANDVSKIATELPEA